MVNGAGAYQVFSDRLAVPDVAEEPLLSGAVRSDWYPVHITVDESEALERLADEVGDRRVALISDDTVHALHAHRLAGALADRGIAVSTTTFPAGEASKSMATAARLLDWLASGAVRRRDVVVAMGGGVVVDTVGWVASVYMRGVPYINVPTTLLADVDAALGGKVAVDHHTAKNLIGAFYQPKAVVTNIGYIDTLDDRQLRSGLAEAVKKGIISSPELFELTERSHARILAREPEALRRLVHAATSVKCRLVERDPYERDLARPLNLGHTVGHALETVTGYGPVLHGEAVAVGIVAAALTSERRGLLPTDGLERMVGLLRDIGLPISLSQLPVDVAVEDLIGALEQIRKIRDGSLRFVLPTALGEVVIADDVSTDEIRAAVSARIGEFAGSLR
ncbi:3-dehydroquinate synthase [Dactylosporangium sp. NPDC048998]|uniref:3-dehydroquinate synthase n=1 Tax=Dactylosporangium sp. NPDC048998 TaxID=3363976 RepID=UPI00371E6E7D